MTGPVYLSNPDRNQIVEILRRRANDIATFKSDIEQDVGKKLNGFPGSVEMALTREMKRLRRPPITDTVASVRDTLLMARDLFPGKANSLDALCRRLEVDNSNRKLHGALLDAELLAEVYIRLTRGQDSLVMDDSGGGEQSDEFKLAAVDLSSFALPVLQASEDELLAHERVLAELDKARGGKRIWQEV